PEAMRRLADLKVEKQFGLLGDGKFVEVAAPDDRTELVQATVSAAQSQLSKAAAGPLVASKQAVVTKQTGPVKPRSVQDPLKKSLGGNASASILETRRGAGIADLSESQKDFEKRAMAGSAVP